MEEHHYDRQKARAKKRGIPFTLTRANIEKLYSATHCDYTGEEFKSVNDITLERINNNKGYEPGNVIPVFREANSLKSNLDLNGLQGLIDVFDKQVNEAKKAINRNTTTISDKTKRIERYNAQIAEIERAIAKCKSHISELENQNINRIQDLEDSNKKIESAKKIINILENPNELGLKYLTRLQKIKLNVKKWFKK